MALRQHKHFDRLGLPEFLGLVLLASAAVGITLWWQDRSGQPAYAQVAGRVVEGQVSWVHYNAPDLRRKVSMTYSYSLGGDAYTGSWVGFWPEDNSPNATSADRVDEVCLKDHPLVVFYDPNSPSTSYLHPAEGENRAVLRGIAIGACALAQLPQLFS